MAFRKKHQFAGIAQNTAMTTLAYNIDPLLNELPSIQAQSLLDSIPAMAGHLPQFRHIAITAEEGVELESSTTLELVKIIPVRNPFLSRRKAFGKALEQWFSASGGGIWISTDPESVFNIPGVKTLLISDAATLLPEKGRRKPASSSQNLPGWGAATRIVMPSESDRKLLLESYPQLESRVNVIFPALQEPVTPLSWAEQEQVKLRYSGGRDFLLYAGVLSEEQNLITLLKAYSLLKKWLMTGMPLIIAGPSTEWTNTLDKLLSTYKYRSDVSIYRDLPLADWKEMVGGAYALLWPAVTTTNAYPLEWAFGMGTPVISTDAPGLKEWIGDAAMLTPAGDTDLMANCLMIMYKDENQRAHFIARGKQLAEQFNAENTLKQFEEVISGLSAI
jgi:glycosyltransferase involved in cell wall biosynthesis